MDLFQYLSLNLLGNLDEKLPIRAYNRGNEPAEYSDWVIGGLIFMFNKLLKISLMSFLALSVTACFEKKEEAAAPTEEAAPPTEAAAPEAAPTEAAPADAAPAEGAAAPEAGK
jgi:hypothetical protein